MFEQRRAELLQRQLELRLRNAELRAEMVAGLNAVDQRWQRLNGVLGPLRQLWQLGGRGSQAGALGLVGALAAGLTWLARRRDGAAGSEALAGVSRWLGLMRSGMRLWRLWRELDAQAATPNPVGAAAQADQSAQSDGTAPG
ncbi:hypothetical protein RQP53_15610 [Paucibacter sp. APW11]|uniref:DUF3318 domain-containing protein n=1 Tax=Roseateles aquae TaxID=3077235 RepID=A0ABU3PEJ3_9BURK|nr:hypothetical protein [Paucibacter sp. APW11]MDT9000702.1 hypothetical protein [Paucibacter sp. APW11]